MITTVLLAAVAVGLPLGAWPASSGPAALEVDEVGFYTQDPDEMYGIVAVQALASPIRKVEPSDVNTLVALAHKLGAEGVILLAETLEKAIPKDPEAPLPTTGRYIAAVFIVFDEAAGFDTECSTAMRSRLGAPVSSAWRDMRSARVSSMRSLFQLAAGE